MICSSLDDIKDLWKGQSFALDLSPKAKKQWKGQNFKEYLELYVFVGFFQNSFRVFGKEECVLPWKILSVVKGKGQV